MVENSENKLKSILNIYYKVVYNFFKRRLI
jgi:hypothetical protein